MKLPENVPTRISAYLTEDQFSGCWAWDRAHDSNGYPCVWWDGQQRSLHRVLYLLIIGPIPDGMVLDHIICENKRCANPHHLIPSTNEQNLVRERTEKETCKHGHSDWKIITKPDGRTRRRCRECDRISARKRQRRQRGIPDDWPFWKHYNGRSRQ